MILRTADFEKSIDWRRLDAMMGRWSAKQRRQDLRRRARNRAERLKRMWR